MNTTTDSLADGWLVSPPGHRVSRLLPVVWLGLSLTLGGRAQAIPPNDGFADAIALPALLTVTNVSPYGGVQWNGAVTGSNVGATLEPGETNNADLAAQGAHGTIWWTWNQPVPGDVRLSFEDSDCETRVGVFEGASVSNLTTVIEPSSYPITDGAGGIWFFGDAIFRARPGVAYRLAAMGRAGSRKPTGTLSGQVYFAPKPNLANDYFADRLTLPTTPGVIAGNNSEATEEPGEYLPGRKYSLWYSWTASGEGILRFQPTGPAAGFLVVTAVFRGSQVASLVLAPALSDGGVPVSAGETVAIQVASGDYGGGHGAGEFSLALSLESLQPPTDNDQFTAALALATPTYHRAGTVSGASVEAGEPLNPPGLSQTLWWRLTPEAAGLLTVKAQGATFVPSVGVFEGSVLTALTPVAAVAGLPACYRLQSGHSYRLQLGGSNQAAGVFTLDTRFQAASNDFFAGRMVVTGTNALIWGNNLEATMEAGETPVTAGLAAHTLWYSWTAPVTGRLELSSGGVGHLHHAIYVGTELNQLQRLAAGNQQTTCLVAVGQTYQIQVDNQGTPGEFAFQLTAIPAGAAPNDDFEHALLLAAEGGAGTGWLNAATLQPGEPAHRDGAPCKSLWWRWQAPTDGAATVTTLGLATNQSVVVYSGTSLQSLTRLARGTDSVQFVFVGGLVYHLALVVDATTGGDGGLSLAYTWSGASVRDPGNLLCEPSFEGTALGFTCWTVEGGLGMAVNELGGADGTTWPAIGSGSRLWQEFPTVPGRVYRISFAYRGDYTINQVLWDDQALTTLLLPPGTGERWHWASLTATATRTTSRLTVAALGANAQVDAFSVLWEHAPPFITSQPVSISVVAGGTASFVPGVLGRQPLVYQWRANGVSVPGGTTRALSLTNVNAAQAGQYVLVVTNGYGSVTSAPATLSVEVPGAPVIVLQPYSDTVALGGYFALAAAAIGDAPLSYQWFRDGTEVPAATARQLVFSAIQTTNAGTYSLRVSNGLATAWSLPARITVTTTNVGGGMFLVLNEYMTGRIPWQVPVFDVDGTTRLPQGTYVAQLYVGLSLSQLRAAGNPVGFPSPGFFGYPFGYSSVVTAPTVPPEATAVLQVRVWDRSLGASYEEARALGSKFGRSRIFTQVARDNADLLTGLQSFSMQSGMAEFVVGRVELTGVQPNGTVSGKLYGQAGYNYLLERQLGDAVWRPLVVLSNATGTITFTDTLSVTNSAVLYRARILE